MPVIFDEVVRPGSAFTSEDVAKMREAYVAAVEELGISSSEDRHFLAEILIRIAKLEALPGTGELASIAVDWYTSRLS